MTDYSDLVRRARQVKRSTTVGRFDPAEMCVVTTDLMDKLAEAIEDLEAWLNEAVTILFLSPKDFDKFVKACEEPAPANEELKKLMRDYGRFLEPAEKQARLANARANTQEMASVVLSVETELAEARAELQRCKAALGGIAPECDYYRSRILNGNCMHCHGPKEAHVSALNTQGDKP